MSDVNPTGQPDLSHYKPKYTIKGPLFDKFKTFYEKMPGFQNLKNVEVHALADGYIDLVNYWMNHMAKYALQQQKEREQREKENQ